jgi:hypothetical protein
MLQYSLADDISSVKFAYLRYGILLFVTQVDFTHIVVFSVVTPSVSLLPPSSGYKCCFPIEVSCMTFDIFIAIILWYYSRCNVVAHVGRWVEYDSPEHW